MIHRAHRCVRISGEVYASELTRQRDKRSHETRVLVRVTVVFLPPQGAGLDISETGNVSSPFRLEGHLDEFCILLSLALLESYRSYPLQATHLDHGLNDAEEASRQS
jgi:hypothetical protein